MLASRRVFPGGIRSVVATIGEVNQRMPGHAWAACAGELAAPVQTLMPH